MNEDQLDLLFHALASQPRREILAQLRAHPGCNVQFISAHFAMSRIGVMKHIAVLEAANLVISEKLGRERQLYFNLAPIQWVHEQWSDKYSAHFASMLTRLKRSVEDALSNAAPPIAEQHNPNITPTLQGEKND